MLIPGENVLVFMPHGYGFAVFVGTVQQEFPSGWIVDPCRTVENVQNDDNWIPLAAGKESVRKVAQYGPRIKGGLRVPLGCLSLLWHGELPE